MANPIRVAQIVGKMNDGGVEAVVMNYYRHIDRSKVQFDFLIDSDSSLVPREEIESLGGRVFEIPPYQNVIEYQRELQRLFREEGWKIVHSHINALSVFPLRAAKKTGVPVRIAHSHSTSGKGEYAKNALKAVLKTQSNRYPTHRFACSRFAGEWLFGKDANFEIVYNAIDLNSFRFNAETREQTRADLGLVGGQFVIGHVGRFMAQKNHPFLIDVFAEVAKRRDDAVLLLVGSGEDEGSIKALVDEHGLSDCVKFLGQRNDVNRLYQAFDVFVLPSLYEGLCLVGVEAQMSGLPCLLSNVITREVDVTGEWYDYVNTGRRADTVYVESVDGLAGREFSQKRVVLASDDYPEDLTCHVRDPKVWRDADGRYYMVLGARRRVDGPHVESRFCAMHGEGAGRDVGEILVYGSADMLSWELESRVSTPERFGFMWECPGYLELEADCGVPVKFLSFSPQGLEGGRWDRGNVYAAGYMPVAGDITGGDGAYELGEFRLWDAGFDFYAPQEFTAEDGRHILIGWMGMPDEPTYGNAPTVVCGWQHCMTVPRELAAGDGGVVLQRPAREIERHYASVRVGEGSLEVSGDTCFDVVVDGVDDAFTATVDGELRLAFVPAEGDLPARFEMRFTDESRASAGCGRTVRWEPVDEVRNVRIVGDVSSVEVFVNDGALVFSTRIYPEAYGVSVDAPGANVNYHTLSI